MSLSPNVGAAEVVRQLNAKTISAEEFAVEVVRSVAIHSDLNALHSFDADLLVENARRADRARSAGIAGPLNGLPIVVKDNINTKSFPTTAGTGALLHNTPKTNAGTIDALEGAGAIVGAKSGMHELAFGITSNNAVTGAVRNPVDPSKISGGSSGGTASAIAAGIFPAGLGTDTGGSCRIPAALCGIVGFRPTTGRYSVEGVLRICHTRDTVGPLGKTVSDIALLDSILAESQKPIEKKNLNDAVLGICDEVLFQNVETEVEKAVQEQLRALEAAGAKLVDVSLGEVWKHNEAFSFPVVFYEVMRHLPEYLEEYAPNVSLEYLIDNIGSPDVLGAIQSQMGDDAISETAYRAAIYEHRPAMRAIYADTFKNNGLTALAFPTTPLRARDIGQDETVELNGADVPTFPTYIRNTDLGSNLGAPGISLPCRNVTGLPIGIEFDGIIGGDADLLGLALAVEDVLDL